jgi:hypothetical protein
MAQKGRKFWLVFGIMAMILACLAAINYVPVHEKIIISPQTTVIDGPVNPDGTINYVAYMDAKYAEGVTPENNAAPLLIKALGPDLLPAETRAEILRRLGLTESEVDKATHLVKWKDRAFRAPSTKPSRWSGDHDDKDLQEICGAIHDGTLKGDPDLEAWSAENADALQLLCEASKKPRLYIPMVSNYKPPQLTDALCPFSLASLQLASPRALDARARLRFGAGDFDGGWADVMATHRLARLVGQHSALISRLVAVTMETIASQSGRDAIANPQLPAQKLTQILDDLTSLPPLETMVDTVDRTARFRFLDGVMAFSRGGSGEIVEGVPAEGCEADWNAVLRNANSFYDDMTRALRTPRFAADTSAKDAFTERIKGRETRIGVSKPEGIKMTAERFGGRVTRQALSNDIFDFLSDMHGVVPSSVFDLHDAARMSLEVEKTAAALALYKARHGRFPGSLKELCPDLLKEVPKDVFSPKGELVYRANDNAYIVYSVGRNLKDDGGVSDNAGKDDIVAKVGDVDSGTTLPASRPGR